MRLYTQILNISKFIIVSHRSYISVYDMTKDILANKDKDLDPQAGQLNMGHQKYDVNYAGDEIKGEKNYQGAWTHHEKFDEGNVRGMYIKKRDKRKAKKKLLERDGVIDIHRKYRLIVIAGCRSVYVTTIRKDGKLYKRKD